MHKKDAEWNRMFGQRLRYLRKKAGLTQVQLALALGYTTKGAKGVISAVERGERNMDRGKLKPVSELLDIPVDVLLEKNQIPNEMLDIISDFVKLTKKKPRSQNWPAIVALIKTSLSE